MKSKIKSDVGEFVRESVLSSLRRAESPVKGEKWPSLSKAFAEKKKSEGLPPVPNMEFEGDMLDSLTYEPTEDGIEIGFFGSEAWKADGHLKFSGAKNNTPQRRFLPAEGQVFDAPIQKGIEQIVADAVAASTDFDRSEFEEVSTQSELYEVLDDFFPGMSHREIRNAVARSPILARLLDDLDLMALL